jgi:ribose transport system ATP-binding protein
VNDRDTDNPNEGILTLSGVSKSFGHGVVLNSADFRARLGSLLGIVGENGAGKSTLLKLAAGLEQPDAGEIRFRGQPVRLASYKEANSLGISMVFQEQALVPQLTVYENLFLGLTERFAVGPVLRRKRMRIRAEEILAQLGIEGIKVERQLSDYNFGQRQLIEIARAFAVAEIVGAEYPVILLDEATASLDGTERQILFRLMHQLRDRAAIVFVSHILEEILELCDELVVLKDGNVVASGPARDYTEHKLHSLITGREVPASLYQETAQTGPIGEVVLEVENFSLVGEFDSVDLSVRKGEVLGIAGVIGSGKESLGRVIAGLEPATSGRVRTTSSRRPGYVAKERLADGIIPDHTVRANASLTPIVSGAFRGRFVLNRAEERKWSRSFVARLDVRPADPENRIGDLSGGNQQKVVMARWLVNAPDVIVLDNPTRGVDVGSKFTIYTVIRELTAKGIAIILISDDLAELIGLSDRVLALREHRVVAEIPSAPGSKPVESEIVAQLV